MRTGPNRSRWGILTAALLAGVFFLTGCDEQTRAALEDGVIDLSSGLVTAFLQAVIQLAGEANGTTAMILLGF